MRPSFRRWRRSRPFWGGLFIVVAAVEIFLTVKAPLPVVLHIGMQGLAGYLVPIIMFLCGVLLWFSPENRTFYSVLALLMAFASWVTSNLGGFLIGLLLGMIGGSLAFSWQPVRPPARPAATDTEPDAAGPDPEPVEPERADR
ncbi:hypothetical protein Daura_28115 [Dactylosporangium aurantiacum]|uniref:Integral membrane protein n=1 Tax=Dactylosporangium aurantiacum TaxID=35754 RepID=A0A9Q9I6R3_9ACTN|nr:DUF6114 domain-containing protein [Dactylosporangium aurantiacum]MDG6106956.1 DUF6114 domain-containing protein [Dactylosporangium aurantiacum]UWZ50684.1 hypothetical protein Daura_28115 [Dactylosporangium aurantiacum]